MPLHHVHDMAAALLASLSTGASVACVPEMQAGAFLDWLVELEPTWYTVAPTTHASVLGELSRPPGDAVAQRLRFARSCSAPLLARLAAELEAALSVPVIEAYGMIEATHQMASVPPMPLRRKPSSVGIATGTEIAILGENGRALLAGEPGEIVIRGETVIAAYEANSEATRAAFVDGRFRTGDLSSLDSEGYLSIGGWLTEIINRGGEKLSPGEVEQALLEHAVVRRFAAFAVPRSTLGEDDAAAVVLR